MSQINLSRTRAGGVVGGAFGYGRGPGNENTLRGYDGSGSALDGSGGDGRVDDGDDS